MGFFTGLTGIVALVQVIKHEYTLNQHVKKGDRF
jgi:hypothetical protein